MVYKNIFLIDDDEEDQEIFLMALENLGSPVFCRTFTHAVEALELLKTNPTEDVDLIFLDLNMPVMNGQQFLTEIKKEEHLNEIPVVIFSTSSQNQTIVHLKELGASDFITKPENFDELVRLLKHKLNS